MTPAGPASPGISNGAEAIPGANATVQQVGGMQLQPPPAQAPVTPPAPEVGEAPASDDIDLRKIIESVNIAEDLDEDELVLIGKQCREGYDEDKSSRASWEQEIEDWLKLATLHRENKSYPWPDAANIKYPLMSIAAMQFSARAYPSLVPANGQLVQAKVYGKDPDGALNQRATRVSKYMSYQVSVEMDGWEEDMDRLLMQLSITGNMYKKTWFDSSSDQIRSESISSSDLIVNYWARNLETAERVSHQYRLYKRQVDNLMKQGIFLETDLTLPSDVEGGYQDKEKDHANDVKVTPYEIIEQHTYLDLDDDGYEEPYIVTFEKTSARVLRIVARFDDKKIRKNDKGKVVYIEPTQYFTKFGFIPNPDGSFYDLGFGHLLGPLNEAVNTLTNQLTDAGTLNNLQSGFIGKGLRVRGGEYNFTPGEWKWVNSVVDDLKKQILPLPTKEPSATLLKLLELLINSGKELASVAEIFVGKMPGQNTPATTTMASIEQGMKVFTAIYKRVYKSLNKEFKKIFDLNASYLNPNTASVVLDTPIGPNDFNNKIMQIVPSADPTASSQQEQLAKAQSLLELLPLGTIDAVEATKRVLVAMEQPEWEKLMPGMSETGQARPPQQPPDPAAEQAKAKQQEMMMKSQAEQEKNKAQSQRDAEKHELEMRSAEVQAAMDAQAKQADYAHKKGISRIKMEEAEHKQKIFEAAERDKAKKSTESKK